MDATGIPQRPPAPLQIGRRTFEWGERTFVMGILNVTPDSFSGDGLLAADSPGDPIERAVAQAQRMAVEGADMLDLGGQSTRPGHAEISDAAELERVLPVLVAVHAALPDMPLSIDTTRARVAAEALDAGASMVNHVWGVAAGEDMLGLVAQRGVPIVLMHNRAEARYANVVAEVLADLSQAIARALSSGIGWASIIVDPGIGFGKTPGHNLTLLSELGLLGVLGRPVLLGTSRKSTIGKVLDAAADERLEGTLATTALAVGAGVDIVRVHDVLANARVARMADAIVRGGWSEVGGE